MYTKSVIRVQAQKSIHSVFIRYIYTHTLRDEEDVARTLQMIHLFCPNLKDFSAELLLAEFDLTRGACANYISASMLCGKDLSNKLDTFVRTVRQRMQNDLSPTIPPDNFSVDIWNAMSADEAVCAFVSLDDEHLAAVVEASSRCHELAMQ